MFAIMDGTLKVGIKVTAPAIGELVYGCIYPGIKEEYRVVSVGRGYVRGLKTGVRVFLEAGEE